MASVVQDIARRVGFRGTPAYRTAEPSIDRSQPVIDNSDPVSPNIRTSIDCYVTGQYIGKKGNVIEVKQRYSLYVSYSAKTQAQTMVQARDRILSDFQAKYGSSFNVANIYVPPLIAPHNVQGVKRGEERDIGFYYGTGMFKSMTETQRYKYDVGTERSVRDTNIKSIKKRYGY